MGGETFVEVFLVGRERLSLYSSRAGEGKRSVVISYVGGV